MGRLKDKRRVAAATAALLIASACTPQIDSTAPRFGGVQPSGVVERVAVTGVSTKSSHVPVCGGAKLSTSSKASSKGGYAPTNGYVIGPGDNLKFNIFGEEGMSDLTARVDDAGYVQLPMVELVSVAGKTTRDIQAELKEAYKAYLINPWVTVELIEAQSAPMYFLGEFNKPGVQYMGGATDILQALALAGGLAPDAYLPGARLLRDDRVCTVDLNALLRNGDFSQNVWIKPRDVIFAPRKEDMAVYVLGAVGHPQSVPFGTSGRTLLEVLSMAGGPTAGVAQLKAIRIVRSTSATSGELIVYDATSVLSGRGLDFPLEPGDVVYVPSSALGDWNSAIAVILPSLTLISGVLTPIALIQSLNNTN